MKRYYTTLLLSVITHLTFAQITMDKVKAQFKGQSLSEIKTTLIDQNKEVARLIRLSSLSLKITPVNAEPSETKTTEKFNTAPQKKIKTIFNEKLNKLFFAQRIVYPNTMLGIDYSTRSLMYSIPDYEDYKFPEPTLKLKKIFFKDGTMIDLDQKINGRDSDMVDEIKGTKWIDSIRLEANYYYPDQMSFINLSTKKPVQNLADGKIILTEIKANEVDLQLSDTLNQQIIKVEGINATGNSVEQSGSSSSSMSLNYSAEFLEQLYKAREDVIAKIDKKEYKNANEAIEEFYQNIPKEDKNKPENLTNATYSFRGNITGVNIFFKPKGLMYNYVFVLKNQADFIDGFTIAQNKDGLSGILDENGRWAVEPSYKRLDLDKGNYFIGEVDKDGDGSILWFDKANKKLVPFNYRFYNTDAYFDKYYSIEDGINGPKGLVDLNTNEILIAPTNDNINVDGKFIVVTTNDKQNRILNKDLKEILVIKDYGYKIHNDFIFVDKPFDQKQKFADYSMLTSTEDIYNSAGQKINKEDYVIESFDYFGKDGLLLVKNKAGKNLFINTKGDVVLNASKYAGVEAFSNGLAPVKNQQGKWGYINPKGEVVIPFIYIEVHNFSKISALVKTESGHMLINHQNKAIKKFAQGFSSMKVSKDAEELEYDNYDGKTYDSKGKVK